MPPTRPNSARLPRWNPRAAAVVSLVLILLFGGCGPDDPAPPPEVSPQSKVPGSDPRQETDARMFVEGILDQFLQMQDYSCVANIGLRYELNGREFAEESSIAVEFHRPDKIHLRIRRGVNTLRLVSDGQSIWTAVEDEVTGNLGNQVVRLPAPGTLTTAQLYAATELVDPSEPNEAVSALFGMPLSLELSPVGLLLDGLVFRQLLKNAETVERLDDATIGSDACQRIQVQANEGAYVFWWDPEQKVLRRIEYPSRGFFAQMPAATRPNKVSVQATFEKIRRSAADESSFAFLPDDEAILVRFFVLPPLTLATENYDQIISGFGFAKLDGQRETSDDWRGRLQVLTWFNSHETSRAILPQLQQVRRDLKSSGERMVIRAVCAESDVTLPDDGLRALMEKWKIDLPVLRDVDAVGRDQFEITEAPTTVVLDAEGRLHFFDVGANPLLAQSLTGVIQSLLAGQPVGANVLRRDFAEREAFETQLAMARVVAPNQETEAHVELPAASQPQKMSVREQWRSDDLPSSGNITVFHDSGDTLRIGVLSEMSDLVIFDTAGEIVRREKMDVPEGVAITRLRAATDGTGRTYFIGYSQMGAQAYVFDDEFRQVLKYPEKDQAYAKILDSTLIDMDGDGELEVYVGFADPFGMHRVDLQGTRVWSNRTSPSVVSVVPRWSERPTYLLTTNDSGTIRPVSRLGRDSQPVTIKNRTIHQLVVADTKEDRPTPFLGVSFTLEGRLIVVGLDRQLHEAWSYGLPRGTYRSQVESPVSAALWGNGTRQWICAGPDGSVHIISDDGSFFDFFHTGHRLRGVASYRHDGQGVLILSGSAGVSAWQVTGP